MSAKLTDEVLPPSRRSVSGLFRAPARATFVCGDKSSQKHRQKLRFCTSSARYARQRFPASSRGHNRSSPLSVKRTACTLTGAEASAAACPSHGRRFSLLPPHPSSLPLAGSVLLNGTPPLAFPLRGRCPRRGRMRCSAHRRRPPNTLAASAATYPLRCFAPQWARFDNRQRLQRTRPYPRCCQRQRRRRYKQSPEPTTIPTALHARVHTAKSA